MILNREILKKIEKIVAFLNQVERTRFAMLAAIVLMSALTVVLPIYLGGIRVIPDTRSYVNFAQAFEVSISNGDFYPGWTKDNLGFGSIGVRFYPPAASFVVALLEKITSDWFFAFWLSLFGWMLLGCFGVYLFVKEWGTPLEGLLAGALYSIAPFHLAEIHRFFVYAEFAAGALIPFYFLYLTRVCRNGKTVDMILLAVSCSALILTHIPSTIIAALGTILYVPIVTDWRGWKKISLQLASAAVISAAATSFYWLSVVTEFSWLAHADFKYSIAGAGRGSFLFPNLLATDQPSFYRPLFRHLDTLVILTAILLLPFIAVLVFGGKQALRAVPRTAIAVNCGAAFGLFMLSKPSGFLWSNFGILQRLQFPWRWLMLVSLLAVVSFSLTLSLLRRFGRVSKRNILIIAGLLMILFAAYDARQIRNTPYRMPREEFNAVVAAFQNEATSVYWWPTWAKLAALERTERVTAVGNRSVQISSWESEKRNFTIGEGPAGDIRLATFYYPHWTASVNGRSIEVNKDENGAIVLPVDAERSEVELRFEEPKSRTVATWLSAMTWILLAAAGVFLILRKRLKNRLPEAKVILDEWMFGRSRTRYRHFYARNLPPP